MRSHKKLLIVDDEANVRLMLQTALESAGYTVIQAEDARSALLRLRAEPCSLALVDLKMPRMDGMELLRTLRAAGDVTPVVILTAHGSIPEAVEAMKLGAIDFLSKPITPDALRKVVAEVIDRETAELPKPGERSPERADLAKQVAFDLARAKRALNLGQFSAAERLLGEIVALDPANRQAHELANRLESLKEADSQGSFRILRDWFPSGKARNKS
jgi:DNA-binding NtrC family response regulator